MRVPSLLEEPPSTLEHTRPPPPTHRQHLGCFHGHGHSRLPRHLARTQHETQGTRSSQRSCPHHAQHPTTRQHRLHRDPVGRALTGNVHPPSHYITHACSHPPPHAHARAETRAHTHAPGPKNTLSTENCTHAHTKKNRFPLFPHPTHKDNTGSTHPVLAHPGHTDRD